MFLDVRSKDDWEETDPRNKQSFLQYGFCSIYPICQLIDDLTRVAISYGLLYEMSTRIRFCLSYYPLKWI